MPNNRPTPSVRKLGAAPANNRRLWAHEPVLRRGSGGYAGRITIEVWSDGATSLIAHDVSIVQAAQQALGYVAPVRRAEVELPAGPVGSHDGGDFLGRVIVEVWSDGAVVGLLGSNESLLMQHAAKALGSSALAS